MSRQPFITADLRPDMAVQSDSAQPTLTGHATTEQLADAARGVVVRRRTATGGTRESGQTSRIHADRATTQSQCAGHDVGW